MDSNDLERERGITILAKNCSIRYEQGELSAQINIVDTPGHADFGGEVERVLGMVDGVLLLVDAVEGPMPQTRFVTLKALKLGSAPIVVVNKVDRPGARPEWVVNQTFELFDRIGATEDQLDFPVVYASALNGWATLDVNVAKAHATPEQGDMRPLFETILAHVPAPVGDPDGPLQFQVAALDYSSYVGRLGIGRIRRGPPRRGAGSRRAERPAGRRGAGRTKARVTQIFAFAGMERVPVESAAGGRHRARHRHRRPHDRHDARGGGRTRGAAADHGRRADAVDVFPGQHVAARRARGQVRDLAQPARPPDEGAPDQRRAARRRDRRHRFLPRVRARRAASHDPDREHAPRRLRARGVAAARRAARDRRRHERAVRAPVGRRRGSEPGRGDGGARSAPRRSHQHGIRRPRPRAARVPHSGARPHRLPGRVHEPDARARGS